MYKLSEAYEQELIAQEINANRHILRGFLLFFLAISIMWILTKVHFFHVDEQAMTIAYVISIIAFLPPVFINIKTDLSVKWCKYCFLGIICLLCAVIASFLSYHVVFLYVMPLVFAIQYHQKRTLWFVYILNAMGMLVSMIVSFYYGLCDLNLLLVSQNERTWYIDLIENQHQFIPYNDNPVFIIVAYAVFPRCIILAVFAILLQYSFVSGNENALRIAQLTYAKEMDRTTNMYNKNKYDQMQKEYYTKVDHIAVLFFDLNSLKAINDKYGHIVGDKAIMTLASHIREHISANKIAYRVGGDEFLLIIEKPQEMEAELLAQLICGRVATEFIAEGERLICSCGVAEGRGKNLQEVVAQADANMYKDKKRRKG